MRLRSLTLTALFSGALFSAGSAQSAALDLTDPEVAHVAVTANSIDIDAGKLALARSRNEAVRQFANTMVTDHSAVNQQAAALAGRLQVTPKDNAVSQSLQAGASDARKSLDRLDGTAFDRAYMDREVAYHQAVLDALDGLLIPAAENSELKKLLVDVRPAIASHLDHAKRVRAALASQ